MRRAVIYARFSSDKQTEMSIEAQVRACKEYALIHTDLDIIKVYADEAVSGKSTVGRTEYQKMLKDARNGRFDVILIHKFDRIARNLGDHVNLQAKLNELGIELIATAQDFGQGKEAKFMRGIQWIMSEYYVDNLTEEVKKGHKEIAYKGLHNGGVAPFGYEIVDQKYVINEREAYWVRRMFEACLAAKGYGELIEEMKENGVTGKRGKEIKRTSIYEILRNEKYSGVYIYSPTEEKVRSQRRSKPNAIRVEGAIPQIVERETWEKVQEQLNSKTAVGVAKKTYKCSRMVVCGECGSNMHIAHSTRKGHTYHYYRCPNKECSFTSVRTEIVDKILDQFCEEFTKPEMTQEFARLLKKYNDEAKTMHEQFEAVRQHKLAEKQKELDTLFTNFTSGVVPKELSEMFSKKMKEIAAEIETIKTMEEPKDITEDLIGSWLNKVLSADEVELPKILVDKIEIKNNSAIVHSTLKELLVGKYGCGDTQHTTHKLECGFVVGRNGCGGAQPTLLATFAPMLFKVYNLDNYITA